MGMYQLELEVSANLVRTFPGVALDMGGSLLKVIYRSKKDWEILEKSPDATKARLHLVSFSGGELGDALTFIRENCHLSGKGEGRPQLYVTGVGCQINQNQIRKQLNVELTMATEFDAFVDGFVYMAEHLARDDFLHPLNPEDVRKMDKPIQMARVVGPLTKQGFTKMRSAAAELVENLNMEPHVVYSGPGDSPISQTMDHLFPCVLVMCGSGIGYMKIFKDGKYQFLSGSSKGGKMLQGLTSLLSGCKSFNDMVTATEKGNCKKIDWHTNDLNFSSDDDLYSTAFESEDAFDDLLFHFGKTVGKTVDDFDSNDLCRSTVLYCLKDVVWSAFNSATSSKVKHVFFTGSLWNTPIMRELVTECWLRKSLNYDLYSDTREQRYIRHHFVRPGSYLGAFGTLLKYLDYTED